jgi:hypothetical protein
MELKFVAAHKPESVNVTVQRRQRLVRRIDQQIGLIENAKDGFLPRTAWIWGDDHGAYFLSIKYGRDPIELKKGMWAIQCDSIEAAAPVLSRVRAMVVNGDFDDQLAKASADIRAKFKPTR